MLVDSPLVGAPLGAATTPTAPGRRPAARAAGWGASAVLPAALGAEQTALDQVWHGVFPHTGSDTGVAVRDGRPPRTLLGPPAGAALGLAGTAVRGPTRNPLAGPGVLGIGAGAPAAVVTALAFGRRTDRRPRRLPAAAAGHRADGGTRVNERPGTPHRAPRHPRRPQPTDHPTTPGALQ
ncbi:iron chelate uptake ABC transporter family permease subunit [Streptomyces sp. NPDC057579]|uniref:iron chelate uptake ABC transporter family permease subunit n=1 Tax=unclassified Streptomyces TaxID=2593676 RepID=UPI00368E7B45